MPSSRQKTSKLDCSRIFSGDVSLDTFLCDYWQQKPLLIRNAFPDFTSPLSAEELAGLACEEDINSRIVIEKETERPWSVSYGPFDEEDFSSLPEHHWTLLVSDVEKHVVAARDIKNCFRFIPDWRIDDLMFSYAPEGGSVGPHLDAYDVFLLQASGKRNWMISYDHTNRFLKDIDLSILAEFSPDESWILEPGDMLYLPPGIAHHGVATEPCITCSIGFRAPSVRAMVSEFAEHVANLIDDELRYTDPGLTQQGHPARITQEAINKLKKLISEQLAINDTNIKHWAGEFLTEPRSGAHPTEPDASLTSYEQLHDLLDTHDEIHHSPASKFLFTEDGNSIMLFVDGSCYKTSESLAEFICQHHTLNVHKLKQLSLTDQDQQTLTELYNCGSIYFDDETP